MLLLIITFSVVLYMTRPTKEETELGNRLAGFSRGSRAEAVIDPDIILKREVYSDLPIINAILRRVKLAADIDTLIKQANSSLTVGRVLFGALVIAFVVGVLGGSYTAQRTPRTCSRSCGRNHSVHLLAHKTECPAAQL